MEFGDAPITDPSSEQPSNIYIVQVLLSVSHCSKLFFFSFLALFFFGHQLCPDLRGEKVIFPQHLVLVLAFFFSLPIFVLAIQDSCLVCTELELFSAPVQVTNNAFSYVCT